MYHIKETYKNHSTYQSDARGNADHHLACCRLNIPSKRCYNRPLTILMRITSVSATRTDVSRFDLMCLEANTVMAKPNLVYHCARKNSRHNEPDWD